VQLVEPSRDLLLLLAEPALDRLDLLLPLLDLLLELDPGAVDDLLGLDGRVLQLGLGLLLGLLHDAAALLGRLADLPGDEGFLNAHSPEPREGNAGCGNRQDYAGGLQAGPLPPGPARPGASG